MNAYGTIEMLETDKKVYQESLDTIFDKSNDGIIITTGGFFKKGIELREQFKKLNSNWGIKNLTKIAPISHMEIRELLERYNSIIVLEENVNRGGLGSSILEIANDYDFNIKILRINLGETFTDHGTREHLHSKIGIDIPSIIKKAKKKMAKPNILI